jgi:putative endonuclease
MAGKMPAFPETNMGESMLKRKKSRRKKVGAWHVYLVRCADRTLYCGVTNNLQARIATHNSGKGAKYTRGRGPVRLVWSKKCKSHSAACRAEYATKQLTKQEKEGLIRERGHPARHSDGRRNAGHLRARLPRSRDHFCHRKT